MGIHESSRYKAIFQALICLLLLPSVNGEIQFAQGPELMLPGLAKASVVIVDLFAGSNADHELFLSGWWPCALGNNTTINLTA